MEYQPPPESLPSMNITSFLEDPSEREWKGPFTFIQGADTHRSLLAQKRRAELGQRDSFNTGREFVICGDMLDAFPYEVAENSREFPGAQELRDKQYQDFVKVFRELVPEVKLVCVCGNHDIGDKPSKETLKYTRQDYFSFWAGGVKFVVLNSQYIYVPDAMPEETDKQMKFMDTIADPKAKFIVLFMHIPFFVEEPEEEDFYFNVPKPRRLELLERLYARGVRYIFCGHYHRNAGGHYKKLELVVTSAIGAPLGDNPSGYRVVNVGEDGISHEYVTIRDSTDFSSEEK
ncbi:Serine/threonine-protein phosphatase CPPED1, partial [Orchesella cincta]